MPTNYNEEYWINEIKTRNPELASKDLTLTAQALIALNTVGYEGLDLRIQNGYVEKYIQFSTGIDKTFFDGEIRGNEIDIKFVGNGSVTLTEYSGLQLGWDTQTDIEVGGFEATVIINSVDGLGQPTVGFEIHEADIGRIEVETKLFKTPNGYSAIIETENGPLNIQISGEIARTNDGRYIFSSSSANLEFPSISIIRNPQIGVGQNVTVDKYLVNTAHGSWDDGLMNHGIQLGKQWVDYTEAVHSLIKAHLPSFQYTKEEVGSVIAAEYYNNGGPGRYTLEKAVQDGLAKLIGTPNDTSWFDANPLPWYYYFGIGSTENRVEAYIQSVLSTKPSGFSGNDLEAGSVSINHTPLDIPSVSPQNIYEKMIGYVKQVGVDIFESIDALFENADGTTQAVRIGNTNAIKEAFGITNVDSIFDLPGNANYLNNFVSIDTRDQYFVYQENFILRSFENNASGPSYKVFNFDDYFYDSILGKVNNTPTNDYLNFSTNFYGFGNYNTKDIDEATAWLTGGAISGGNYSGSMPSNVLNGNGISNVLPSGIVTDSFRPGAGTIGTDQNFVNNFNKLTDYLTEGLGNFFRDTANMVYNAIVATMTGLQRGSSTLQNIDPLVLDLNGDGVKLISFENSITTFDIDNDGYVENTGWVSGSDGILVHDRNGNEKIDNITETISEYYGAAVGQKPYTDGLHALKSLDSNNDGIFNASDNSFSTLRVWQDKNEDGQTDTGELKTLSSLGITSINLNGQRSAREEVEGNHILVRSSMIRNGQKYDVAAVDFTTNPMGYEWNNVQGGVQITTEDGTLSSFKINNAVGASVNLVAINSDSNTDNNAISVYGDIGNDIIAGDSQNNWLVGSGGSDKLYGGAGDDILVIDSEDNLNNIDAGTGFDTIKIADKINGVLNLHAVNAEVGIGGEEGDIIVGGSGNNVFMRGGGGNDTLVGGSADDALAGEDGDDLLDGGLGDDILRGHKGQDLLIGNDGEDYLDGGLGDDEVYGGLGDDLLVASGGNDVLYGGGGYDVAEFRGTYDEYEIKVQSNGSILVRDKVANRDGTDILTGVEAFNFKDITEISVNAQSPMTVNDIVSVTGNGPYVISKASILANDIDYQNNPLTLTSVLNAKGGTVSISGGNIIFTPDANYHGARSFQYHIKDNQNHLGASVYDSVSGAMVEMAGTVYLKEAYQPNDELFFKQWYLTDANIIPVWADYTGKNIKVGVYEVQGIPDVNHPDLINNLTQATLDSESSGDYHATLVAGIIGAEKNNIGTIGVAYEAQIEGIHAAFTKEIDSSHPAFDFVQYDIVNNSWGWTEPFMDNFHEFPDIEEPIFKYAASFGREGLGTILLFGGGNDRAEGGNANDNSWMNNDMVITVGAVNKQTNLSSLELKQTAFSNPGANILISAPGSNMQSASLLVENNSGATYGDEYQVHQGTSFATPVVSGVIALMLEANPNLGYRDVQEILAYSAKKVNDTTTTWQTNGASNWNGGGLHFSHDYGFGEVDALAAVRLAETWTKKETFHNYQTAISPYSSGDINRVISDNATFTSVINVNPGIPIIIEHVKVTLNFSHGNVGDLVIKLTSPDGTQSILLNRPEKSLTDNSDIGHGAEDIVFTFGSWAHMGELVSGNWTLQVTDSRTGGTGVLRNWSLDFSYDSFDAFIGDNPPANSTYIYTDEYLNQTDSTRFTLSEPSTHSQYEDDTLNLSAFTKDVNVNLTPGTVSSLGGKNLSISSNTYLDRVFTGDGNDSILGNAENNLIYSGRGNDTLNGGAGNDWLFGGSGSDTITGGLGGDIFVIQARDKGIKTITDFNAGSGDKILLANFADVDSISDLTISQSGANTRIFVNSTLEIILSNINATSLNSSHFTFNPDFIMRDVRLQEYIGTSGNDNISIGSDFRGHSMKGGDGNDTLWGGYGNDTIYGGKGNDTLIGNPTSSTEMDGGEDIIYGEEGNDTLYGSGEQDILDGGAGSDVIYGNLGNDIVHINGSYDQIVGGDGAETYIVHCLTNGTGTDLIHDFEPNIERIDLREFKNIKGMGDLRFELGQDTIGSTTVNVLKVWLSEGTVKQYITLKGFTSTSALIQENFIFNEDTLQPRSDNFSTLEDTPLNIAIPSVLSNDNEGMNAQFSKFIGEPENGKLINNGSGNYTYTPNENFSGIDEITYEVKDENGETATSKIWITVNRVNDAPVWNAPDIFTANIGREFIYLPKFSDAEGDFLTYTASLSNGSALPSWMYFDPNSKRLTGIAPSSEQDILVKFTAFDGVASQSKVIKLSFQTLNPIANTDEFFIAEDLTLNGNVLSNNANGVDRDADGGALSVIAETKTTSYGGTVTISSNGNITYIPSQNFNGIDTFNYTLLDGQGGSSTGAVEITVSRVNDTPVATNNSAATTEDKVININVLGNDTDADGDSLNITSVTQGSHGTVSINSDKTLKYTPIANYNGTDNFTYTISDGHGGTSTASVSVTISAVNDVPVAGNNSAATDQGKAVVINVLANDTDIDGDILSISTVTQGAHGTVTINANKTLTYTPYAGYNGTDSFTYTVSDGQGGTDTATVNVTIKAIISQDQLFTATAGNDDFDAGNGIDTITYAGAAAAVTVSLASSSAQATGGSGTDTLKNFENIIGSSYNDILVGSSGANNIKGGNGNDIIDGGAGNDVLDGGNGIDSLNYSSATAAVRVNLSSIVAQNTATSGIDTISNFENIIGSAYNDTLTGSSGANNIQGGDGNDTIDGGAGNDVLDGGNGIDTLNYSNATTAVRVNLGITSVQNTLGAGNDTISGFERINGSAYNDILTGSSENNIINGNAGDDTIDGGLGTDVIDGGDGIDTLSYTTASAGIYINLDITGNQNTKGAGIDKISNFENITGSAYNDNLTGSNGNNIIKGGAGDDIIEGNGGDDVIDGSSGINTASYANAIGGITADLSISTAQHTVGAGIDTLLNIRNLIGSSHADILNGSSLNNNINGGAGADIINGKEGADILTGGVGNDTFVFDTSSLGFTDTIQDFNISESDKIDISDLMQVYNPETHSITDFVQVVTSGSNSVLKVDVDGGRNSFVKVALIKDVSGITDEAALIANGNLIISHNTETNERPIANNDFEFIYLNTSANISVLNNDTDPDNDILRVLSVTQAQHGTVSINPDNTIKYTPKNNYSGMDSFNYTLSDGKGGRSVGTVSVGVDSMIITGTDGPDQIYGTPLHDTVYMLNGDNGFMSIVGGNDTVYGGNGVDVMVGGAGNDLFYGYDNDDILFGGYGHNKVYGGNGNDNITSLLGNDEIYGEAGDDLIQVAGHSLNSPNNNSLINGGDGIDTLKYGGTSITVDLGNGTASDIHGNTSKISNIESVLGYNGNDTIIGDIGENSLEGLDGNDYLDGRGGNDIIKGGNGSDTLIAGDGRDTLYGGKDNDLFIFQNVVGIDRIVDFSLQQNDKIDISELLQGYDPLTKAITDFAQITTSGSNSILKVDVDGGANNFVQIATINNITGLTDEQALVNSGNLVVV